MQKIIDAEKSDLFNVLADVGYAVALLSREEREARARVIVDAHFSGIQQAFLDFVVLHCVKVGVEELETEKLTPLLRLRYRNSPSDSVADLGGAVEIKGLFVGLYAEAAA
jgi:type I restriction enzyme, R subunit